MSVNETIMANKLRRSKTLSLLLVVLFTVSTMSLPACSDNDNNTGSLRVVHATVYFDDEGPAATAWVQDGDQNFVSEAILSINGRPFELIFFGDEASDEDNVPIYYLELHDLKGGDSLTFVAKRSDGTLIYAPPSAEIPMPIELVEPEPDQTIVPGEAVVVRWAGGEGGTHIAACYADDLGEEQYMNVQKYGDVESITVPPGIIKEVAGIIGATALSGDHPSFQENANSTQLESSFVVHRYASSDISPQPNVESFRASCPRDKPGNSFGKWCPNCPMPKMAAAAACTAEFAAIGIGLIVWGIRYAKDAKKHPPCRVIKTSRGSLVILSPLMYCMLYSSTYSHMHWDDGCVCPRKRGE